MKELSNRHEDPLDCAAYCIEKLLDTKAPVDQRQLYPDAWIRIAHNRKSKKAAMPHSFHPFNVVGSVNPPCHHVPLRLLVLLTINRDNAKIDKSQD
jgi:hypothetical protein